MTLAYTSELTPEQFESLHVLLPLIHLSVVCCGRAVPLWWRVLEHNSATVAFEEYQPVLRRARWLLRHHSDVMLLADRGFANHELMQWLRHSHWHYCLRLPCDVFVHTTRRYLLVVGTLYPQGKGIMIERVL